MNETPTITDVLSGKAPLKFDVSIDMKTLSMLVAGIFIAVLAGVVIARKIS